MILKKTLPTVRLLLLNSARTTFSNRTFYSHTPLNQSYLFRLRGLSPATKIHEQTTSNGQQALPSITEEVEEVIALYPFVKMKNYPSQILQALDEETKKIVLAWQCLEIKDKAELKKASQFLVPEQSHLKYVTRNLSFNGQGIFSSYFEKHLPAMAEILNSDSATHDQKVCCLNTLAHMRPSRNVRQHLKFMRKESDSPLFMIYWVVIKIKNELPYMNNLKAVEETLLECKDQDIAIHLVYILTILPYFYKYYTTPMVKGIFLIFRKNLRAMTLEAIFICLKRVYQLDSKYSLWLAEDLENLITSIDSQEDPFFVSLAFKTLSYCKVLEVPTEHLVYHLLTHLPDYRQALIKARVSEQEYIYRLFQDSNLVLSLSSTSETTSKLSQILVKYFTTVLIIYQEENAVNSKQLSFVLNLLMKQRLSIPKQALKQLALRVLKILSKHGEEKGIRFLCLNCLLTFDFLFHQSLLVFKEVSQIKHNLSHFFKDNCQIMINSVLPHSNINEQIILLYQSFTCNLEFSPLPDLSTIRFKELSNYSMQFDTFEVLLNYLSTCKLYEPQSLFKILTSIQYIMFNFFNQGQMPFKSTLQILTLANISNYSNPNLFPKICKAIYQITNKYPNFRINKEDLLFLEKELSSKKRGNPHLNQFIQKSIENQGKYEQYRQEYVKKQQEFYLRQRSQAGQRQKKRYQ